MSDPIAESLSTEAAAYVYERFPDLKKGICPTCKGKGYYHWQGQTPDCDCARQIQLAKHYSAAGIGRTYQRLSWADFQGPDEVTQQVHGYLEHSDAYLDRGVGLLLSGTLGTGKTLLANLVLKEMVLKGLKCYATTFAGTIEAFTSTWGDKSRKQWFENCFMYSQVLLLDDLGKEMRSANKLPMSTFDNILRTRINDSRPTIMTTNMTTDNEFVHGYGSAVLSQLKGSSILIKVPGADFRRQNSDRTLAEIDAEETRPIV